MNPSLNTLENTDTRASAHVSGETLRQDYSVRLAREEDIERISDIFQTARQFMRDHGNTTQWNHTYPDKSMIRNDIDAKHLRVICTHDGIAGVFALIPGADPTYAEIDGAWACDEPYAAIHRVASDGAHHGIFACTAAYARERHGYIRIDTHADNIPMQRALDKAGFAFRGIIYLEDGEPRRAYDWKATGE